MEILQICYIFAPVSKESNIYGAMKCLIRLFPLIFLISFCRDFAYAQSIRQLSNRDGLSNSAVLSLCQDSQGMIWMGTCDGLNTFDGKNISLYQFPEGSGRQLSGNLIEDLLVMEGDIMWIRTNYGLDRLDIRGNSILNFDDFMGAIWCCKSPTGIFYVLKDDGSLYYFAERNQTFHRLDVPLLDFNQVLSFTVDKNNVLWIFGKECSTQSFQVMEKDGDVISIHPVENFGYSGNLVWAFAEEEAAYLIDETYDLYEYDFNNQKAYFIAGLADEINTRGEVSALIKQGNDYYIGFKNSGLVVLKYQATQKSKSKYQLESTPIRCGIFCLIKDKFQDIVWVGSDGQGVYMYFNDLFSVNNTLLDTPVYGVDNPVRALYCDFEHTLWVGTKGDGILRMKNYRPEEDAPVCPFDFLTVENSSLTDNSVYCFTPSKRNILWMGTEKGLNYYDYSTRQLQSLSVSVDGKKVRYIHSIQEQNDTTVWISTVGEGVVKVILYPEGPPRVKRTTCTVVEDGRMYSNYFFTSFLEGDSVLWLGNRGYGLYHLDIRTNQMTNYRFDTIANSRMVNDVFAIHHNEKGYWLGTGSGVLHFTLEELAEGKVNLLAGATVHGIVEDYQHNLWYGTNQGLVCHNLKTNVDYVYNNRNGLSVTEFSDGAFHKDPWTNILYFGGTNGFVSIVPSSVMIESYVPPIYLNGLFILGKKQSLNDYLSGDNKVRLDYAQNFFQLDFIAIDHINGNNYSYSYKLEEANDQWISNGFSSRVTFSNLAPGKYTLWMKYRNNVTGEESSPQSFVIFITPPWYLSYWAYALYVLVFIVVSTGLVYRTFRRYRWKQRRIIEKIRQQKKEEIYESKLRFFTNITHEFCTPLTLIYGPCEKILSYEGTDAFVRKYAQLIQQNTEKLNALILELLEFRRLETGHKELSIQPVAVSDELIKTARLFSELVENRKIIYCLKIAPGIIWNTDISCFSKIANNLISNAFKYTPDHGQISIELKTEGQELILSISNTGKGISKEDLPKIFDRYKVLDSFELSGANSRIGLGLAICKSMITLLSGNITVESIQNQVTTFTVTLPVLTATNENSEAVTYQNGLPVNLTNKTFKLEAVERKYDDKKQTIMIIDDDLSMLWFVSEVFVSQYNVLSFDNADDALVSLERQQPTLIISDVMMQGTDGLIFAQKLKQNKFWNHIPLVLLSALHHENDQMKGIEAGADAYVTKPFNIAYLEKIVYRLIQRETDLKEYHHSAFSTMVVENGKLQNKEDQLFMSQMMALIKQHLTDADLSVEMLAAELGCSTRQFYRKLKFITEKTPADLIKECRLVVAERLLMEQNFTIEEIIFRTGFGNRSSFYKAFSLRYGMPPTQYRKQQKEKIKNELSS